MRIFALFALLVLLPAIAAAQDLAALTITTADGKAHAFQVELATTPQDRGRGLMYRRELADDRGMLFIFPRRERIAMWMRNTPLPLDMLFIADDGKVTQVHQRAVPYSEATISSTRRVRYVLELAGGTADRLGIEPGDVVTSEAMR